MLCDDGVEEKFKVVVNGVDPTAIFKLVSRSPMHIHEGYTGTLNEYGVALGIENFWTPEDKTSSNRLARPYFRYKIMWLPIRK